MKTEKKIREEVMEYLQKKGWFVFWNHQKGYQCYAGISDLTAIKNGHVLWIELKTENGKLRESQEKFKEDIYEHGGTYIVATGWEIIHNYIKQVIWRTDERERLT